MATIDGYTKQKMDEIVNDTIISAAINGSGHLILTKFDSSTVDAGVAVGPTGAPGVTSGQLTTALAAPQVRDKFCVLTASSQSIASGAWTAVNWTTENADASGFHTGSSSVVTLPAGAAGLYAIHAMITVSGGAGGVHVPIKGYINAVGTPYGGVSQILSAIDGQVSYGADGTLICVIDDGGDVTVTINNSNASAVSIVGQLQMYRLTL